MDLLVIPECYVDTNLIETLVPPQRGYNHQKGCGTVTKVMKEKLAGSFALGIIDKDKREVDYLKEFIEVCINGSLILHKHPERHHYIIQINPAIERFIINSAQAVRVSLIQYGLPEELESLKKLSKTVNSKKDERFKKLFRTLHRLGSPEIVRLANWIEYLKKTNYKVDLEIVRAV